MHTSSCLIKEEISEAAEQILKDMGYNVRIINSCITYINWGKGVDLNVDSKTGA